MKVEFARRTKGSWAALILSALAFVSLAAAFVVHGDLRIMPIALVLGCLLVLYATRAKASATAGAVWSGSADLLQGGKKFSGQLSLEVARAVWRPSKSSLRRGMQEINIDLTSNAHMTLESGRALLDVIVSVSATHAQHRFLTRGAPALKRAIQIIST